MILDLPVLGSPMNTLTRLGRISKSRMDLKFFIFTLVSIGPHHADNIHRRSSELLLVGLTDFSEQIIALSSVTGPTGTARAFAALKRGVRAPQPRIDRRPRFSEMAFADGKPVERFDVCAGAIRLRLRPEIVFEILPIIAALVIRAERATRVITAMHH